MSLNQLQQIEAVIREKQEVDHDRRMYHDGYKAALDELLFVVVKEQKKEYQEPPQVKPMENPVAFVLREMEKTCKSISAIPGPVSCRSSCPYYLPKENPLPDGNVTMCMKYVLKANLERMRIESGWETVNGISKNGDGYEVEK